MRILSQFNACALYGEPRRHRAFVEDRERASQRSQCTRLIEFGPEQRSQRFAGLHARVERQIGDHGDGLARIDLDGHAIDDDGRRAQE